MTLLTLFHYTPPARHDDVAWTQARIEQASTEAGSYTTLETIELDPVDTDPRDPRSRSFTTDAATVEDWYRIVWIDADGDVSDATLPVQFLDATVTRVYGTRSELARRLKLTNIDTDTEAALDRVLLISSLEVEIEIGRTDLAAAEIALATQVSLTRAGEHWHQLTSPFGFVGLGLDATPFIAARDSWERHAFTLSKIKGSWGIA